jgi:hypothetical protein
MEGSWRKERAANVEATTAHRSIKMFFKATPCLINNSAKAMPWK